MGMIRPLIKLLAFWMLYFAFQQFIFLAIHFPAYKGGIPALFYSFWKALPLNISTAAYFTILPLLMLIAGMLGLSKKWVNGIIKWETIIILIISSLVSAADIGLYEAWGTKINTRALAYLEYPSEVLPLLFAYESVGLVLIGAAQIFFGIWLRRKLPATFEEKPSTLTFRLIFPILSIGLCILAMRGGTHKNKPVNRNWVFHSRHAVLNYAALNSFWNMADLLFNPVEKSSNPYHFFDEKVAEAYTREMHAVPVDSTTARILNTDTPNIVIIFLESWAADVIECLGGEQGVTPKFCELTKEGLLFTQFYSTGYRTEQGYLATLSGMPALPVGSIMQSFKFDKLPNIYKIFNDAGYTTSFYTGGLLEFDNVESYLRSAGVEIIKGEEDWEIVKRTSWGAYDEETFSMHLREMHTMRQPFFSSFATMTTHEWFDADVPVVFSDDGDKVNDQYRNTMHYADSCLYAYLQEAKRQSWYSNTLFIVMADHACKFPKKRDNYETERHHIPMMLFGGALRQDLKGKTFDKICSHVDIPATLLAQVKRPSSEFPYSKNVFNASYPDFAYYTFDNGFGLIAHDGKIIYDHNQLKEIDSASKDLSWIARWGNFGKAYLQVQYEQSLNYATVKRSED